MFWKLIGRHIFYPFAIFMVIFAMLFWLISTQMGCKTSFEIITKIIPGKLKIKTIKGSWISQVEFSELEYENSRMAVSAETLVIKPHIFSILKTPIDISSLSLKNINNAHITIGDTKINITNSNQISNQLDWTLTFNTSKKIKADLKGYLIIESNKNTWSGKIETAYFSSPISGIWQLINPSIINLSTTHLTLQSFTLVNTKTRSRLQGKIHYNYKKGLNTAFDMPEFFVPKQALLLKNLHLNISGIIGLPLQLQGYGYSGEGKFDIKGIADFSAEKKISIDLKGKNLKIYNTRNMQIIASPQITIDYLANQLFIKGIVEIHEAYIAIQDQKNMTLLSRDIILTHPESIETTHGFKITPHLYVIINNNLHFNGYGIDGVIGGKLNIDERQDGLLMGKGRLTIKTGKYRLQGATRYINHGRLLFPAGTLLRDPLLDIKISQHRVEQQRSANSPDVGLYIQGTLQHPIYYPYSNNSDLKSADILSRLGFGRSETAGDESQRQLFAQTAFLFSGTANPFIDFLQKNLNLEEFNLESRQTNKTFYTQGGTDTVLVIGKSLSPKLYLQYLQSIMEPITTIRLKYFLSRYFTASVETGSEGLGGDLTFSMERD
jgi:translocation and assembly module TamB